MATSKTARRQQRKAKPAGMMPRKASLVGWTYYRLHDRRDLVVGFKRVRGDETHYIGLTGEHWHREAISYAEAIRLSGEMPGFVYLKDPEGNQE